MEDVSQCPVCNQGLGKLPPSYVVGRWTVVLCPGCGLGITSPRPTLDEIADYYRPSFFSFRPDDTVCSVARELFGRATSVKAATTRTAKIVRDRVKLWHDLSCQGGRARRMLRWPVRAVLAACIEPVLVLPPWPGRVLDIGFGRGEFLLRAKRAGWEPYGVEVSDTSVAWGQSLGFSVKRFDGAFRVPLEYADKSFDLVVMSSVLEHVHDPAAALRECRRLLKPGGVLAVIVPNLAAHDLMYCGAAWHGWNLPQHLFHFEERHIICAMKNAGLLPKEVKFKTWYSLDTEKQSLDKMYRNAAAEGEPFGMLRRFRAAFVVRFGKRLLLLVGRLPRRNVANGMCIYGIRAAEKSDLHVRSPI